MAETFDFSRALAIIRESGVVARGVWSGAGATIGVLAPPRDSGLTPFVAMRSGNGMLMPWQPGQQDMFADDWFEVRQEGVGHG